MTTLNQILLSIKTKEDLAAAVKQHPHLDAILYYAYAPWVWFDLPEGDMNIKPLEGHPDLAYRKLLTVQTVRLLDTLRTKGDISVEPVVNEKYAAAFIQLAESVAKEDCYLLIAIKDKRLFEYFPILTYEFVDEALPVLLIENYDPNKRPTL